MENKLLGMVNFSFIILYFDGLDYEVIQSI